MVWVLAAGTVGAMSGNRFIRVEAEDATEALDSRPHPGLTRTRLLRALPVVGLTLGGCALVLFSAAFFSTGPRSMRGATGFLARKNAVQGEALRYSLSVINLEDRQDRLVRFVEKMEESTGKGLVNHTCRFSAVDGRSASTLQHLVEMSFISRASLEDAKHNAREYTGNVDTLTPGMIGCYASHWSAMRRIASDHSLDFGLIAEDDLIHYSPDFGEQFRKLWDNSKGEASKFWEDADIVYLQWDGGGWTKGQLRDKVPTTLKDVSGQWIRNLGLYAVSRRGARKLAGAIGNSDKGDLVPTGGITTQIDAMLPHDLPDVKAWAFTPPIGQCVGALEEHGDTNVQVLGNSPPIEIHPDIRHKAQSLLPLCPRARAEING